MNLSDVSFYLFVLNACLYVFGIMGIISAFITQNEKEQVNKDADRKDFMCKMIFYICIVIITSIEISKLLFSNFH